MFTGLSSIFGNKIESQKICKSVTMAMQGNDHGTLQNFPFFFTVVPTLSVCIFVQNFINILERLMKEQLYWKTSVKFDK